jgi:MHS family proline/betaine transporter-like MFS transporter
MLASGVASALHGALNQADMLSWGWRIPFLAGGVLTVFGFIIRQRIEETPVFAAAVQHDEVAAAPLSVLFRHHWRTMLQLLCIMAMSQVGYYLMLAYMATYLELVVGLSASQAGVIVAVSLLIYLPLLYLSATAGDLLGRQTMLLTSSILFVVFTYPLFLMLGQAGFWTALSIQFVIVSVYSLHDASMGAYLLESFPTNVRLSGFALPFNLSAAAFGGTAPLLAEWLIQGTGVKEMPAFIMMAFAAASVPALLRPSNTAMTAEDASAPLAKEAS